MKFIFLLKISCFFIFPIIGFFLSLIFTKFLISFLPKIGVVDVPRKDHVHSTIIPTSGGIAIVLSFILASSIFLFWNSFFIYKFFPTPDFLFHLSHFSVLKFFFPLLILAMAGLYDDSVGMSSLFKLFMQILVASICWYFGIKFQFIFGYELPSFISYFVTVFWILAFINAFNLIDGLDGLAGGLASVSCFCLGFVLIINGMLIEAVVVFILAGSTLGFLRYNFHPAQIFMGDVGSMSLGFTIAVIGIVTSTKSATFASVLIPILAVGIPLFDTFLAIWRRVAKKIINKIIGEEIKCKIMSRDSLHIHHRILSSGKNQTKTTKLLYCIAIVFAVLAVAINITEGKFRYLLFFILFILVISTLRNLAYYELWTSSQIVIEGLKRPKKGVLILVIQPFIDFIFLIIAFTLSFVLSKYSTYSIMHEIIGSNSIVMFLKSLFLFIFPVLIALNISRVYRTYWLKTSSEDYFYLLEVIVSGFCASFFIIFFIISDINIFTLLIFFTEFFVISAILIIGERMFLRYLKDAFGKKAFMKAHINDKTQKVVVYGSDMNCKFYLKTKYSQINSKPPNIIGIIDDNKTLKKQYAYGLKILGSVDDIEAVYLKKKFDKIAITIHNGEKDKIKLIESFCNKYQIELTNVYFYEEPYIKEKNFDSNNYNI